MLYQILTFYSFTFIFEFSKRSQTWAAGKCYVKSKCLFLNFSMWIFKLDFY